LSAQVVRLIQGKKYLLSDGTNSIQCVLENVALSIGEYTKTSRDYMRPDLIPTGKIISLEYFAIVAKRPHGGLHKLELDLTLQVDKFAMQTTKPGSQPAGNLVHVNQTSLFQYLSDLASGKRTLSEETIDVLESPRHSPAKEKELAQPGPKLQPAPEAQLTPGVQPAPKTQPAPITQPAPNVQLTPEAPPSPKVGPKVDEVECLDLTAADSPPKVRRVVRPTIQKKDPVVKPTDVTPRPRSPLQVAPGSHQGKIISIGDFKVNILKLALPN
jgi:hypothetical protein